MRASAGNHRAGKRIVRSGFRDDDFGLPGGGSDISAAAAIYGPAASGGHSPVPGFQCLFRFRPQCCGRCDLRHNQLGTSGMAGTKDANFGWLAGATVRGWITRVEHRKTTFLFSVAFETLDLKGVVSPFYAKLIHNSPFALFPVPEKSTSPRPSGHGRRDWSATFMFDSRASHYVFRASFESKWLTTAPDAANCRFGVGNPPPTIALSVSSRVDRG